MFRSEISSSGVVSLDCVWLLNRRQIRRYKAKNCAWCRWKVTNRFSSRQHHFETRSPSLCLYFCHYEWNGAFIDYFNFIISSLEVIIISLIIIFLFQHFLQLGKLTKLQGWTYQSGHWGHVVLNISGNLGRLHNIKCEVLFYNYTHYIFPDSDHFCLS